MRKVILLLILHILLFVACKNSNSKTASIPQKSQTETITYTVSHVSISINRTAEEVYQFASNPENFPKWAAGLLKSIKREGDIWIGKSDIGDIKIRFTPNNGLGII